MSAATGHHFARPGNRFRPVLHLSGFTPPLPKSAEQGELPSYGLGIGSRETPRNWVKQHEVDAGRRPGTTTEESAQLKALKKENAELKRANEILKAAASFFAAELDRPQTRS